MDIPTLDKCPGYNLYIGGFISLRRPQALKNANITHIVSVLDWKFDDDTPLTRGYQHLHIPVDDVEDENLLEWFPRSNAFIDGCFRQWQSKHPHDRNDVARTLVEGTDGGGVLIHCAMGKSRSATVLLAYLLWSTRQTAVQADPSAQQQQSSPDNDMVPIPTKPLSVVEALMLLRQGRPIAEPNEGFMDQLHMYEAMGCPTTEAELKKHKIYRRWMNKRSVEESLRVNMAPEMDAIRFEDESDDGDDGDDGDSGQGATAAGAAATASSSQLGAKKETRNQGQIKGKGVAPVAPGVQAPDGTSSSAPPSSTAAFGSGQTQPQPSQVTLKCRKCRHVLATTPFMLAHVPPPHPDPAFQQPRVSQGNDGGSGSDIVIGSPSAKCAHIFLSPLSWMRGVLSEGQMEGRLACPNPKCNTNIGKFAWTGLRCSCGGWVTPGFAVARARVDEVVQKADGVDAAGPGAGGGGLRLPPGMRRGGGNL